MGAKPELSPDEWRTLQLAPFWMLSAVVGAYNGFDSLEYEAFTRSLHSAASAPGRLSQEVMTSVASDLRRLGEEFAADTRTIASGLCDVEDSVGFATRLFEGNRPSIKQTTLSSQV